MHSSLVRKFNTRDTGVTLPEVGEVYRRSALQKSIGLACGPIFSREKAELDRYFKPRDWSLTTLENLIEKEKKRV